MTASPTRSSPSTASGCTPSRRGKVHWCSSCTASRSRGTRTGTSSRCAARRRVTAPWRSTSGATAARRSAAGDRGLPHDAEWWPTTSPSSHALGEEQAVVVGHDWGAPIAWNSALLRPDVFRAVVGLSVPFAPAGDARPTDAFRAMAGDEEFYIEYFQRPGPGRGRARRGRPPVAARVLLHGIRVTPRRPARGHRRHDPARGGDARPLRLPDTRCRRGWVTTTSTCTPGSSSAPGSPAGSTAIATSTATGRTCRSFRGRPIEVPALFVGGDRDGPTIWGMRVDRALRRHAAPAAPLDHPARLWPLDPAGAPHRGQRGAARVPVRPVTAHLGAERVRPTSGRAPSRCRDRARPDGAGR